MNERRPEVLRRMAAQLLECPTWDPATHTLLCVDIPRGRIHRLERDPADDSHVDWDGSVGAVAWRRRGGLAAATSEGFALSEGDSQALRLAREVGNAGGDLRMNDGRCDRHGRFWAGTASPTGRLSGALYRLEPNLEVVRVCTGILMSNGIGWTAADDLMYYVDSGARVVYRFPFDLETGNLGRRDVFVRPPRGIPDGLAVDADGCVWLALWGAGKVVRYAADGRAIDSVSVPVRQVSSCAFIGDDLTTLAVTTARQGLSRSELRREPRAGDLFAIATTTCGLPPNGYAG